MAGEQDFLKNQAGGKIEEETKFTVLESAELGPLTGKDVREVMDYVMEKYPNRFLSHEQQSYLARNSDKVPEQLKDGKIYYCLPTQLGPGLSVPSLSWDGKKLIQGANSFSSGWTRDGRVLLLE